MRRGRTCLRRAGICGLVLIAIATGCSESDKQLEGTIAIEGSSTLLPLTSEMSREFNRIQTDIVVAIEAAGTGDGFAKFCDGQTDIQTASRPIDSSESQACLARGVAYIELPVAYDALTVVVNAQNDWATCITTAQLKTMWAPESDGKVTRWSQIDRNWPDHELRLVGPGAESGTFDYFTQHINGRVGESRHDYARHEDDHVLVEAVAGDRNALGYFGLAYYLEERYGVTDHKVQALKVDGGKGCVLPAPQTVDDGDYPLSRPLFIYVSLRAVERREVRAFVDFYLDNVGNLADRVGYVRFPDRVQNLVDKRWKSRRIGTLFATGSEGASLERRLQLQ